MARRTSWTLLAAAAATLAVAGACSDSHSPPPRALLGLPDVGTLAVTVTTSGSNTPSGYTVIVDGSSSQSVGINGLVTFIGLPPGSHTVLLSGVPSNCSVSGNPRTVSLIAFHEAWQQRRQWPSLAWLAASGLTLTAALLIKSDAALLFPAYVGLRPDAPSDEGVISRVVGEFAIHRRR